MRDAIKNAKRIVVKGQVCERLFSYVTKGK